MKKNVLLCILSLFIICFSTCYAEKTKNTVDVERPVKIEKQKVNINENPSVGYVLLRGLSNVALGVIAIPKEIVYENSKIPIFGIVSGTIYGAGLFVWRELSGVVDIITFGFSGQGLYFRTMGDFPWDGPWIDSD
jgi:putative exosortase-associated protein (TIGR04073 family)